MGTFPFGRFTGRRNDITVWLLSACSVVLLAASIYRATTFPFTHDESLSYAGFTWNSDWSQDANNHWLNSWLMYWCMELFGNSELSLRTPNILAHSLYLASTLLLIRHLRPMPLMVAGFAMFNLNPFVLDFFFLARGYGLALAFTMLSLGSMIRAIEKRSVERDFLKNLALSIVAGALAVLSNFSFLNYFLPLVLAGALLAGILLRRFSRRGTMVTIAIFSSVAIFLAVVISNLFRLREQGDLYFGGQTGFIADTVKSLSNSFLYGGSYKYATGQLVVTMVVGSYVMASIFCIYLMANRKKAIIFYVMFFLLTAALALPILQHWLLGINFPIERAALYYFPPYVSLVVFSFQEIRQLIRGASGESILSFAMAVLVFAFGWHFHKQYTTTSCFTWGFDAHDDQVLEMINKDRIAHYPGQVVVLGSNWLMEPSLNFYRMTRKYEWLAPITRRPIDQVNAHYVYAFKSDIGRLNASRCSVLAVYSDTDTSLLRCDIRPELL